MKIIALIIIMLCVFAIGYYVGAFPQDSIIKKSSETTAHEVPNPIKAYLRYASAGEWDNAVSLLSGEALLNATTNLAAGHNVPAANLLYAEVVEKAAFGDYLIIDISFLTATLTPDGDRHNKNYYRFYLKQEKIFKITEIQPRLGMNNLTPDPNAANIVRAYLNYVQRNDWDNALNLLTGSARKSALRNIETMPIVDFVFADLGITLLGSIDETTYIEARYKTEGPVRTLFEVRKIKDRYYISEIYLVETSLKDGGAFE